MMKTLVIGDIHGGLKALEQLLITANPDQKDTIIFLGDYVDGWSESAQVIDFLRALDQKHSCIFILGNHDAWCKDWLKTGDANPIWLKHGGLLIVKSYEKYTNTQKAKHLAFFDTMKDYFIDKDNNLFIHAGFSSMHGPQKEHYSSNYSWDRTLWEMAVAMDNNLSKNSVSYPKRLLLFNEIFIGHTPTLNYQISIPMNKANIWNLDTGAAFTGKLSCLDIKTKTFWQSEPLQNLYPNEKGRN